MKRQFSDAADGIKKPTDSFKQHIQVECVWSPPIKELYLRTSNKGKKNIRCFPACKPSGHLKSGFCGQPLCLTIRDLSNVITEISHHKAINLRHVMSWGEFTDPNSAPTFSAGQIVLERDIRKLEKPVNGSKEHKLFYRGDSSAKSAPMRHDSDNSIGSGKHPHRSVTFRFNQQMGAYVCDDVNGGINAEACFVAYFFKQEMNVTTNQSELTFLFSVKSNVLQLTNRKKNVSDKSTNSGPVSPAGSSVSTPPETFEAPEAQVVFASVPVLQKQQGNKVNRESITDVLKFRTVLEDYIEQGRFPEVDQSAEIEDVLKRISLYMQLAMLTIHRGSFVFRDPTVRGVLNQMIAQSTQRCDAKVSESHSNVKLGSKQVHGSRFSKAPLPDQRERFHSNLMPPPLFRTISFDNAKMQPQHIPDDSFDFSEVVLDNIISDAEDDQFFGNTDPSFAADCFIETLLEQTGMSSHGLSDLFNDPPNENAETLFEQLLEPDCQPASPPAQAESSAPDSLPELPPELQAFKDIVTELEQEMIQGSILTTMLDKAFSNVQNDYTKEEIMNVAKFVDKRSDTVLDSSHCASVPLGILKELMFVFVRTLYAFMNTFFSKRNLTIESIDKMFPFLGLLMHGPENETSILAPLCRRLLESVTDSPMPFPRTPVPPDEDISGKWKLVKYDIEGEQPTRVLSQLFGPVKGIRMPCNPLFFRSMWSEFEIDHDREAIRFSGKRVLLARPSETLYLNGEPRQMFMESALFPEMKSPVFRAWSSPDKYLNILLSVTGPSEKVFHFVRRCRRVSYNQLDVFLAIFGSISDDLVTELEEHFETCDMTEWGNTPGQHKLMSNGSGVVFMEKRTSYALVEPL